MCIRDSYIVQVQQDVIREPEKEGGLQIPQKIQDRPPDPGGGAGGGVVAVLLEEQKRQRDMMLRNEALMCEQNAKLDALARETMPRGSADIVPKAKSTPASIPPDAVMASPPVAHR